MSLQLTKTESVDVSEVINEPEDIIVDLEVKDDVEH